MKRAINYGVVAYSSFIVYYFAYKRERKKEKKCI